MISEGSRDIEDWSNDAENSALIIGIHFIVNEFFSINGFTLLLNKHSFGENRKI